MGRKRLQNEKKFTFWEELPDGGRKYWLDIPGKKGWRARYVKEVDANEETTAFRQELSDGTGRLVEIHEKFPEDRGHRRLRGEGDA